MKADKIGQENNKRKKNKVKTGKRLRISKSKKFSKKFEQNSLASDVVQRTKDTKIIGLLVFKIVKHCREI